MEEEHKIVGDANSQQEKTAESITGELGKSSLDDLLDDALNDFEQNDRRPDGRQEQPEASTSGSAKPAAKFDPLGKRPAKKERQGEQRFSPLPGRPQKGGQVGQKGQPAAAEGAFGAVPPDVADLDQELSKGLERLMKELADVDLGAEQKGGEGPRSDSQFADTLRALSQTQAELREASGIPHAPPNAAFSDPIFQGLQEQFAAAGGGGDALGGIADGIMRQLLSKDVLYQPMKDIGARYPAWLEAHRNQLPPAEWQQYSQQYAHIQDIIAIYEQQPENYTQLFTALQQMQACGQPPQDIVNELAPGLSFDEEGLPKLPTDAPGAPGCCVQ